MEMRDIYLDHLWQAGSDESRVKRFREYFGNQGKDLCIDDWWGMGHFPGSSFHFVRLVNPLAKFTTLKELEEYPFPDDLIERFSSQMAEEVKRVHARNLAAVGRMEMTIFEVAWYLRGMEELLADFYVNEEFALNLLDRITVIRSREAASFARAGVDLIALGDDVGTQRGLLMSISSWRKWLKPRLAKVIESAKSVRPGLPVRYHSDGKVDEIVPELIEIGGYCPQSRSARVHGPPRDEKALR